MADNYSSWEISQEEVAATYISTSAESVCDSNDTILYKL